MNRIEDAQRRIYAAIGRIEKGLDHLSKQLPANEDANAQLNDALEAAQKDQAELATELDRLREAEAALHAALTAERETTAAHKAELEALMTERSRLQSVVEAAKDRSKEYADKLTALRGGLRQRLPAIVAEVERQKKALAVLDARVDEQRNAFTELSNANKALVEANEAGLSDPELINTALKAELDALRAQHDTDKAEREVILGQLNRLLDPPDLSDDVDLEEEVS